MESTCVSVRTGVPNVPAEDELARTVEEAEFDRFEAVLLFGVLCDGPRPRVINKAATAAIIATPPPMAANTFVFFFPVGLSGRSFGTEGVDGDDLGDSFTDFTAFGEILLIFVVEEFGSSIPSLGICSGEAILSSGLGYLSELSAAGSMFISRALKVVPSLAG